MLFRVVRPMKRKSSRSAYFVQRIPADIKHRIVGQQLAIPFGETVKFVRPSASAQSISFSLRTDDPGRVKILQATIAAHLEALFQAYRNDTPVKLTHRQATALAGDLYRAWADGEYRARSISIVHVPGEGWQRDTSTQSEEEAYWEAIVAMWEEVGASGDPADLKKPLGPIVDGLLLSKGIRSVDGPSRSMLLSAFWMALRDAFESRQKNNGGDYSHDPKAQRFPEWEQPRVPEVSPIASGGSLRGLVDEWWTEATGKGFESVRLIRFNADENCSGCHQLKFSDLAARLGALTGKTPAKPTGLAAKLHQELQPSMNELFFTRNLVLVEGLEDVAIITSWLVLTSRWNEFRQKGIHIVPAGGKAYLFR